MSPGPFSHSNDLKRLREEGYFVQIKGGLLVLREVPYVTASRKIKTGTLISGLDLAGDVTKRPESHQVHFDGEFPCDVNGVPLTGIGNGGQHYDLGHGLTAKFHFSTKPEGGYPDYYEKMTHYANLLAGPAANLKPGTTARGYQSPDEEDDCVFNYTETASDRVGIGALTQLLAGEKIAIIGLGGTGSYILDFVAKTPVREVRLFDQDEFLQHNAFRASRCTLDRGASRGANEGAVPEGHLLQDAPRHHRTRNSTRRNQHRFARRSDVCLPLHGCW